MAVLDVLPLILILLTRSYCTQTELTSSSDVIFIQIEEEQPPATTVYHLSPANAHHHHHTDKRSDTRYQVLGSTDYFALDERTGEITTSKVIDRESVCDTGSVGHPDSICTLRLDVIISNLTAYHLTTLQVEVTDLDDSLPEFLDVVSEFYVEVEEGPTAVNRSYEIPAAVDRDSSRNRDTQYSIQHHNAGDSSVPIQCFELRWTDTDLYLLVVCELDRETDRDFYSLEVLAFSLSHPSRTSSLRLKLRITDDNDNRPRFTQTLYQFGVSELAAAGDVVGHVTAEDADSTHRNARVSYQLQPESPFIIDPVSGIITVSSTLDYELRRSYSLTVTAEDHGSPTLSSIAIVRIDLTDSNDIRPEITVTTVNSNNSVSVREHTASGAFVAHVEVHDGDMTERNNRVSCSVNSTSFSLSALRSARHYEFSLTVNSDVDREKVGDSLELELLCTDTGDPPKATTLALNILVEDINDQTPEFAQSSYLVTNISESDSVGTHVLTLIAEDKDKGDNAQVTYELMEADNDKTGVGLFSIDPLTGEVSVAAELDYESEAHYRFIVLATDGGHPPLSSTSLLFVNIINVNDNAPEFLAPRPYNFTVPEHSAPAGSRLTVGRVQATDADRETEGLPVWYRLVEEGDSVFHIHRDTGVIYTRAELDREEKSQYQLTVVATDYGEPALSSVATVTVSVSDVNDNPPQFVTSLNSTYSMSYQLQIGEYIGQVSARDSDTSDLNKLTYSLLSGPTFLDVVPHTGQLLLIESLTMNSIGSYSVTLCVTDSANHTDTLEVILSVIDSTVSPQALSDVGTAVVVGTPVALLCVGVIIVCLQCIFYRRRRRNQTYVYKVSNPPMFIANSTAASDIPSISSSSTSLHRYATSGVMYQHNVSRHFAHLSPVTHRQSYQDNQCTTDSGCGSSPDVIVRAAKTPLTYIRPHLPLSVEEQVSATKSQTHDSQSRYNQSRRNESHDEQSHDEQSHDEQSHDEQSHDEQSRDDVFSTDDLVSYVTENSSVVAPCSVCQNDSVVTWSHVHVYKNDLNKCFIEGTASDENVCSLV